MDKREASGSSCVRGSARRVWTPSRHTPARPPRPPTAYPWFGACARPSPASTATTRPLRKPRPSSASSPRATPPTRSPGRTARPEARASTTQPRTRAPRRGPSRSPTTRASSTTTPCAGASSRGTCTPPRTSTTPPSPRSTPTAASHARRPETTPCTSYSPRSTFRRTHRTGGDRGRTTRWSRRSTNRSPSSRLTIRDRRTTRSS